MAATTKTTAADPAPTVPASPKAAVTAVSATEAAPLTAPAPAPEPPEPVSQSQEVNLAVNLSALPEFVGYVDDDGTPITDLATVFDTSGIGNLVTVRRRVNAQHRPANVTTICTTLVFAAGAELPRAQVEAFLAQARLAGV